MAETDLVETIRTWLAERDARIASHDDRITDLETKVAALEAKVETLEQGTTPVTSPVQVFGPLNLPDDLMQAIEDHMAARKQE